MDTSSLSGRYVSERFCNRASMALVKACGTVSLRASCKVL